MPRSRGNDRYTTLSIINQQRCCSVPFLLSEHSSAGIGIKSRPRSYIPWFRSRHQTTHWRFTSQSVRWFSRAQLRRLSSPAFSVFCASGAVLAQKFWECSIAAISPFITHRVHFLRSSKPDWKNTIFIYLKSIISRVANSVMGTILRPVRNEAQRA